MERRIRAKLRCMSSLIEWNHTETMRFLAVKRDGDEENAAFWEATPDGEMELRFMREAPHIEGETKRGAGFYDVGAYYYVDMVADDAGGWRVTSRQAYEDAGAVRLERDPPTAPYGTPGPLRGSIALGLTVPGTLELFGAPGTRYRIEVTHAERSDGPS